MVDKTFSSDSKIRLSVSEVPDENCDSGSALTSQENLHCARFRKNAASEAKVLSHLPRRLPVLWPRMSDVSRWKELEDQVAPEIPDHWLSEKQKIDRLETVTYDVAQRLFGVVESRTKKLFLSRRQKDINTCRANRLDYVSYFPKSGKYSNFQSFLWSITWGYMKK